MLHILFFFAMLVAAGPRWLDVLDDPSESNLLWHPPRKAQHYSPQNHAPFTWTKMALQKKGRSMTSSRNNLTCRTPFHSPTL